jgi:hypothetical protein
LINSAWNAPHSSVAWLSMVFSGQPTVLRHTLAVGAWHFA